MLKVLYHANCNDGFAAAWVVWRKYGESASYIPCQYNEAPPDVACGSEVIIVDFSFKRDVLLKWENSGIKLLVLDHHKTAQEQLLGLKFALFDQSRCGAVLTWEHFFHGSPVPLLLKYVQDRDLWHNALPHTEEVYAAMRSLPHDFAVWENVYRMSEEEFLRSMIDIGTPVLERRRVAIEELATEAMWGEIAGYRIPIAHAEKYWSDVAHRLLELYPDAPFSACWRDDIKAGVQRWEVRSRGDFDVSAIAREKGGGGHSGAAGFETQLLKTEV